MRMTERKHEKPFWIIWSPSIGLANKRYESESAAFAEAEQLAEREGETFYVMKSKAAIGHMVIEKTTRTFFTEQPLTQTA